MLVDAMAWQLLQLQAAVLLLMVHVLLAQHFLQVQAAVLL